MYRNSKHINTHTHTKQTHTLKKYKRPYQLVIEKFTRERKGEREKRKEDEMEEEKRGGGLFLLTQMKAMNS